MIFFSRSALTASPVRNLFFQKLCFVTIKMKYEAKPLQKWIPHRRSRECGAVFDNLRGAGGGYSCNFKFCAANLKSSF
jgi:hypothetical protein